jgi:3-hydroxy-3-methylglutaryl CoA synthase
MAVLKIIVNKQSWVIKNNFYDTLIEMYHNAKNDVKYTDVLFYFPNTISDEVVKYLNRQNIHDTVYLCCFIGNYYCISFSVNFIDYLEKQTEQITVP